MHVYLDMDSVQADFCGHWARTHSAPFASWISEPEIRKLTESSHEHVYNFFRHLPPMRGGMRIVYWLKATRTPFTILSAPLIGNYTDASIKAKIDWLDHHNPGTSPTAIFTRDKHKYAVTDGKPNILIDDYEKNIRKWRVAGGHAIQHVDCNIDPGSYRKTLKELKHLLATK